MGNLKLLGIAALYSLSCLLFSCQETVETKAFHSFENNDIQPISGIDKEIELGLKKVNILHDSVQYTKAMTVTKSLWQHPDFHTAKDTAQANVHYKLGVLYFLKDHFYQAIIHLDTAIVLRTKILDYSPSKIAQNYFARSQARSMQSSHNEALKDVEQAISLVENSASKKVLVDYYLQLAVILQKLGDFGQADYYYQKTLELNNGRENNQLANIYNNLGNYHSARGNYAEQKEKLQKALDLYQKLGKKHQRNYLMTDMNFGMTFYYSNELKRAEASLQKTLQKIKATGEHYYDIQEKCLTNLGYIALKQEKYSKSLDAYQNMVKVVGLANPSPYQVSRAQAFEGIGDVKAAQNNFTEALHNYHQAIKSLCIGFNTNDVYATPSIENHLVINETELLRILGFKTDAIVAKYQAEQQLPVLKAALRSYQCMDSLIVQIRQQFNAASSRFDIVAANIPMYENAVDIALQLYEKTNDKQYINIAFNLGTKNKAIVLQEGLQDEKAKFARIPSDLLDKENTLKRERYLLEADIIDLEIGTNKKELKEKKKQRFQLVRTYEKLIQQLEQNYPEYYQLKHEIEQFVEPQAIIDDLPEQSALIEFFVGTKKLYVFTLSTAGLQYYSFPKPADLSQLCNEFREMFQNNDPQPTNDEFSTVAYSIYQLLLEKPLTDLTAQQNIKRLIIIPDDYLTQISFDALLDKPLKENSEAIVNWSSSDIPYLIRKYAISYAYSNRLLSDPQGTKRIKKAVQQFAGFGLEYDDYTLKEIKQLNNVEVDTIISRGMGKLYHSVAEVKEVKKILGKGNLWINEKATKKAFLQYAPKAQIIHLAMHGYETSSNPLNAALIFSHQKNDADFLLKTADLYAISLQADMAVLSACQTASGKLQKGEGVRSLARAFRYAGCPSLIATLWSVSDYPTKEIMVDFYHHLTQGESRDVALQKAKLNYLIKARPSQSMPYYWTNLVMIGVVDPLQF